MKASYDLSFNKIWGVTHGTIWWFDMEWPSTTLQNLKRRTAYVKTFTMAFFCCWKTNIGWHLPHHQPIPMAGDVVENYGWIKLKKKLYGPFLWMGFNCLKARATSRRQFTFYHFIDLRRMEGWVNLGGTQWFWTQDPWIGNLAP